jgi:hypothetical protein
LFQYFLQNCKSACFVRLTLRRNELTDLRAPTGFHQTVHRIVRGELALCKVNFKLIPHSLRELHKQERVRISVELLRFLEESSRQKLAHVFTGDESWLYLEHPRNTM